MKNRLIIFTLIFFTGYETLYAQTFTPTARILQSISSTGAGLKQNEDAAASAAEEDCIRGLSDSCDAFETEAVEYSELECKDEPLVPGYITCTIKCEVECPDSAAGEFDVILF